MTCMKHLPFEIVVICRLQFSTQNHKNSMFFCNNHVFHGQWRFSGRPGFLQRFAANASLTSRGVRQNSPWPSGGVTNRAGASGANEKNWWTLHVWFLSLLHWIGWNITLYLPVWRNFVAMNKNGELTFSTNSWLVVSRLLVYYVHPLSLILHHVGHTLDGRNPAPPRMFKILWIMGYTVYQLLQDIISK